MKIIDSLLFVFLISSMNYDIPSSGVENQGRMIGSFLFSTILNLLWTPLFACADFYFSDFELLSREYRSECYRMSSYYIAKFLAGAFFFGSQSIVAVPIICLFTRVKFGLIQFLILYFTMLFGCICSFSIGILFCSIFNTAKITSIMTRALLLPVYYACGMVKDPKAINLIFRILQYVSVPRYTVNILIKNQFRNNPIKNQPQFETIRTTFFGMERSFLILILMMLTSLFTGYILIKIKINKKF